MFVGSKAHMTRFRKELVTLSCSGFSNCWKARKECQVLDAGPLWETQPYFSLVMLWTPEYSLSRLFCVCVCFCIISSSRLKCSSKIMLLPFLLVELGAEGCAVAWVLRKKELFVSSWSSSVTVEWDWGLPSEWITSVGLINSWFTPSRLSVSSFWPLEIIRTLTGADCFPWLQPCGQTQNIYMDRDSRHSLGAWGNRAVKTWIHEFLITQSVGWSIIQFYLWASMSGSILTCTYSGLLLTRWVLSPLALLGLCQCGFFCPCVNWLVDFS